MTDVAAMLDSFAALARAGDHHAALQIAADACRRAPEDPRAHYAHGHASLAVGRVAFAASCFAAAVRLRPIWPDAWVNLGLARYREGRLEYAIQSLREALRHDPGHVAAKVNLSVFLRLSGGVAEAETLLREVIARAPGNIGARLNLAAGLLMEGDPEKALAVLDDATARPAEASAQRHWLLQRTEALLLLKRPDDARSVLRALEAMGPIPAEIAPLWHSRRLLLARISGDDSEAVREAGRMAKALEMMGPLAMPEHRIAGHFELAGFWRGRHECAPAFAHWRAGHALLSQSQAFSREAHRAFVEASTRTLVRSRFESAQIASNRDRTPVFIVGMPRSGTTLCEQIIAAHPKAFGAGERTALGELLTTLGGGVGDASTVARIAGLDRPMLDVLAGRYLADLHALAPYADRIVDKMPGNYRLAGLAALLLPAAKFIHCVRDPRDIGLSIFTFRFHGMHGYAHDLADLGWTIGQQARLMSHWREALPGRILTVALNDWIDDFHGTLERVLMHIGLEYDPACERFHELDTRVSTVSRAQVREPVNARGLDRWREYEAELEPLISELRQAGVLAGWDVRNRTSLAFAAELSP